MDKIGVIHGRFQGFHLEHLEYILDGLKRCEHLIIGITNYDIYEVKPDNEADPTRASKDSNPFNYYHRYMMIKNSLLESNVKGSRFDIVPFPIEFPERIKNFVPTDAKFYLNICDGWGEKKLNVLKSLGLDVEVMRVKTPAEKGISGTQVREAIRNGKEWRHLVPSAVYEYIISNNLVQLL